MSMLMAYQPLDGSARNYEETKIFYMVVVRGLKYHSTLASLHEAPGDQQLDERERKFCRRIGGAACPLRTLHLEATIPVQQIPRVFLSC